MLRESSRANGDEYDLTLLTGGGGDGRIAHGALLVALAEAVVGDDDARLASVRADILACMGDAALVDAAAIAATFNAIDRVADATGIVIEPAKAQATEDLRAALGIDAFAQGRG